MKEQQHLPDMQERQLRFPAGTALELMRWPRHCNHDAGKCLTYQLAPSASAVQGQQLVLWANHETMHTGIRFSWWQVARMARLATPADSLAALLTPAATWEAALASTVSDEAMVSPWRCWQTQQM
mmetsp:Transcript_22834/g.52259  ORF Transcript_22834/g.52259 Transcript_22834/m.52259 type:complete len:125 (+) Transcript_22834:1103-1477(+)